LIIKTDPISRLKKTSNCPFCNPDRQEEFLLESKTTYAIFDKFPVSKGHILIIPKRHCSNYFNLSLKEQNSSWVMINQAKDIVIKKFNPSGFNIGININEAAGQTISHVHIHLIPRYEGDVLDPRGGVRCVIPDKKIY
jgi:diadenosine tetraphosphate (Ap4A) HIT family hydrolase